jgi:hypothetical protein
MLWIFLQNQEWLLFSNRYLMKMNKKSTRTCFFYQGDDVAILNKVMQYVQNNETTKKLRLLTLRAKENNDLLIIDLKVLDRAYPRLILSSLNWRCFWPYNNRWVIRKWNIPKNFMFIGSPGDRFSLSSGRIRWCSFNYVTLIVDMWATKLRIEKIKTDKNYRLHTFQDGAFNIKVISILKLLCFNCSYSLKIIRKQFIESIKLILPKILDLRLIRYLIILIISVCKSLALIYPF